MTQTIAQIRVNSKVMFDKVLAKFTCFTRPDRRDEIIIDMNDIFDVDGNFQDLAGILEINKNTDEFDLIENSAYVCLYLGR